MELTATVVQHEFGIDGGTVTHQVLALLRELNRSMVTALHTILCEPNGQR